MADIFAALVVGFHTMPPYTKYVGTRKLKDNGHYAAAKAQKGEKSGVMERIKTGAKTAVHLGAPVP
jgi:hypothetical protein